MIYYQEMDKPKALDFSFSFCLFLSKKETSMCGNCAEEYNDFPSTSIAGPPGDYTILPRVPSHQFVEYQVVSVATSGVNPGVVQVSGVGKPQTLDLSGGSTYNGENPNNAIPAQVIPIGPNQFLPVLGPWEQVSSPNGHIFIRIDGATAATVTVKQRVKILKVIPAPFATVSPDHPEDMSVAREKKILDAVYGAEGEQVEYGQRPAKPGTVRDLATGSAPATPLKWWKR